MIKKTAKYLCLIALVLSSITVLTYYLGARINTTRSIPVGLYWKIESIAKKDSYVVFCPPQKSVFDMAKERGYISAGYCPGQYGYMMKKIMATENDVVKIAKNGVYVNGQFLKNSQKMKHDGGKRPMPQLVTPEIVLKKGEVLLMSDVSKTSFDARYFGVLNKTQIESVITPVITW